MLDLSLKIINNTCHHRFFRSGKNNIEDELLVIPPPILSRWEK